MTIGQPLAFLLLAPLAAVALLLWFRADLLVSVLPGHWDRVVAPELRGFLAGRTTDKARGDLLLCLAALALLVTALAEPGIEAGPDSNYGNQSGRVIVLDLGSGLNIRDQRLFAQQLIEAAPETPTAIVAVAADAYDIVPLTTDRRQLSRYLSVLEPRHMPEAGRALHIGLAHAEATLSQAGIVASQIVLVTGGPVPDTNTTSTASDAIRVVAALGPDTAGWAEFVEAQNARLADPQDPIGITTELREAIEDRLRARSDSPHTNLTPLLIGLALLLWLALFRRRSSP